MASPAKGDLPWVASAFHESALCSKLGAAAQECARGLGDDAVERPGASSLGRMARSLVWLPTFSSTKPKRV
jgi:hypothetical protein